MSNGKETNKVSISNTPVHAQDNGETSQRSLSEYLVMTWLVGMMVLLPLDFGRLPYNMTPVDFWVLMGLPLFWLSVSHGKPVINLTYVIPMGIILLGSFASIFSAPAPRNSLIVILKEGYAFAWFITLVAVLATLNAKDFRRIMVVWATMVFFHGAVIVAQFLSPEVWRFSAGFMGRLGEYERYRPSGFFYNANSAAFFQLLGFVPLVLASRSRKTTMFLGILLLPTMLLTGSMGATLAFMSGLTIAIIALSLSGYLGLIIKMLIQSTVAVSLLGGLLYFIVSHNQPLQEHFNHILFGRSERSFDGRLDLWQRGMDAFMENDVFIRGIGPENFRVVDGRDKQLHNDFVAFSVERGLLGTLGLVLFGLLAMVRAVNMIFIRNRSPDRAGLAVVVFLAAIVAAMIESLTHQTFHFRELWIILAFQEALIFKMTLKRSESAASRIRPKSDYLQSE